MVNKSVPAKVTEHKDTSFSSYLKEAYSKVKNNLSKAEKHHQSPDYKPVEGSSHPGQTGKMGKLFHRTTSFK